MWIKTKIAFTDLQAGDAKDADVPADAKMNVTAERGAELIALGIAEPVEGDTAEPTKTASK